MAQALADVRLAKQKIDRFHAEESRGFNVKLGRGGIREIEFVAQALQLAHGGRDAWLQAPHTLISLGRLADRGLIGERERSELSDAYNFLRTVEHRLQMEQGLQTHTVPEDPGRRALLARRMHFAPERATEEFDEALRRHTSAVSRAFARVFDVEDESRGVGNAVRVSADAGAASDPESSESRVAESQAALTTQAHTSSTHELAGAAEDLNVHAAAAAFAQGLARVGDEPHRAEEVERLLREEAARSLNRRRALLLSARVGASLAKTHGGRGLFDGGVARTGEAVRRVGALRRGADGEPGAHPLGGDAGRAGFRARPARAAARGRGRRAHVPRRAGRAPTRVDAPRRRDRRARRGGRADLAGVERAPDAACRGEHQRGAARRAARAGAALRASGGGAAPRRAGSGEARQRRDGLRLRPRPRARLRRGGAAAD